MNVVVFGGCGYLGRAVSIMLARAGHRVTIADRFFYGAAGFPDNMPIAIRSCDARLYEEARSALRDQDAVVWLIDTPTGGGSAPFIFQNATDSLRVTLEACGIDRPVDRFILLSWLRTNATGRHGSVWGSEDGLAHMREQTFKNDLRGVRHGIVLQIPEIVGAISSGRLRLDLAMNSFVARALQEGQVAIPDDGLMHPYISLGDAALAVKLALSSEVDPDWHDDTTFQVSGGSITYSDFAELVRKRLPEAQVVVQQAATDRQFEQPDVEPFSKWTGYKPGVLLDACIGDLIKVLTAQKTMLWTDPVFHNHKMMRSYLGEDDGQ